MSNIIAKDVLMFWLRNRWNAMYLALNIPVDIVEFERVLDAYVEPHRRYHGILHLERGLRDLRRLFPNDCICDDKRPGSLDFVELAWWYHDVVWQGNPDDEQRSADWAAKKYDSITANSAETLRRLIMTTRHDDPPQLPDESIVAGIDLIALADPWEKFVADGRLIREEYLQASDAQFQCGRLVFAKRLLAKEQLFWIAPMTEAYEAKARVNLKRLVAELEQETCS